MKNSLGIHKYLVVLAVLFCTANTAFSKPVFNPAIKVVAEKYGITMLAILVFSFVIYLGLTVYNRFFVIPRIKDSNINSDSLRTPSDKEDAIISFLTRNRLR